MPSGPGTYGNKVGRPPKKYKKKKPNKRVDEAAYGVGGDSRLEGAIISPPLDPRGGVDRFPDDIDVRRETPVAKSSRGFAPFDKKKKKKKAPKKMNAGGRVRGAGKATQGVRKCKMVTMKGA